MPKTTSSAAYELARKRWAGHTKADYVTIRALRATREELSAQARRRGLTVDAALKRAIALLSKT